MDQVQRLHALKRPVLSIEAFEEEVAMATRALRSRHCAANEKNEFQGRYLLRAWKDDVLRVLGEIPSFGTFLRGVRSDSIGSEPGDDETSSEYSD